MPGLRPTNRRLRQRADRASGSSLTSLGKKRKPGPKPSQSMDMEEEGTTHLQRGRSPSRRSLQSPCRETLRNQRLRHTPSTRQTPCLRVWKRFVPWGVCRRLPSDRIQFNYDALSADCSGLSLNFKRQNSMKGLSRSNSPFRPSFPKQPLNPDSTGRILNTDRRSRIFHAEAHQKSRLRVDGAQVSC